MLEAQSHNKLKILLKRIPTSKDNLTLSRLIARSLREKEQTLVQLDLHRENSWWSGLLIPLHLESANRILVVSEKQKNHLLTKELPLLRESGMGINFWEKDYPPNENKVWLMNYNLFLDSFKKNYLFSKQIIIPEAENLNDNLRNSMSIQIEANDWESLAKANPNRREKIISYYNQLSRRLFFQASSIDPNIRMDGSEIYAIKSIIKDSNNLPLKWSKMLEINNQKFASWAELKHNSLNWTWHIQPLDPICYLRFIHEKVTFLLIYQTYNEQYFLHSELNNKSNIRHKKINLVKKNKLNPIILFAPKYQPLPNSKIYKAHIINQSKRLIIGFSGLTILIIDDHSLLLSITSELAGEFGRKIAFEKIITNHNGVICCRSSWWLNYQNQIDSPKQLIFGTLPIASLSSPLTAAKVEVLKREGRNWFKEILLPDALNIIAKSVIPFRNDSARLAILDGRLRSRSWGNAVLKSLQPIQELYRLLPC